MQILGTDVFPSLAETI